MSTRTSGRHRMAVRPRTPLTTIGDAVSTSASSMSRRSAVIAASSGLVVTMGLPAAGATPLIHVSSDPTPSTTSQSADPAVAAPSGAQVSFAVATLTTVDGAQYAHDAAVAAAERDEAATAASRDDADRGDDATTGGSSSASSATGSTVTVASTTVASSALGSAAVDLARRYIGIPYRYGGTTPAGFDCSGFVQYVYGHLGVALPRTAAEQSRVGTRVSAAAARPGDIVSFYGSGGVFHNGIYLGEGRMINSPRTGQRLQEQAIWSSHVVFTRVSS